MDMQARRREPERAGLHRLAREVPHAGKIVGGRRFPVGAALSHRIDPERRMRQIGSRVDVTGPIVERIEIFGERLPVPRQTLSHDGAGNILDAFHGIDQQVVVFPPAWSEADAAIAHDYGCHAMRR